MEESIVSCDITLKSEDWHKLHNAICDLRSLRSRSDMSQIIIPTDHLDQVISRLQDALRDGYAQEDKDFESKYAYYRKFGEQAQMLSIWSLHDLPVGGFSTPHEFVGVTHLIYDHPCHQFPTTVRIGGALWSDLYCAADLAIRQSGDLHHVFIESFEPVPDQPGYLRLVTGS